MEWRFINLRVNLGRFVNYKLVVMTNLFNRIGRAALMALTTSLVVFFTQLGLNLEAMEGITPLEGILVGALVAIAELAVEYFRDQFSLQKERVFRTFEALTSVSVWARLGRGLMVGAVGFLVIVVGEWATILPELSGLIQLGVSLAIMGLNALIEYLRDKFDIPALR